jgi:hypothetical protein
MAAPEPHHRPRSPSASPTTNIPVLLPPPLSPPSPPAAAPIHYPWTAVLDAQGAFIPYLQQTIVPNFPVRKNAQSATTTKTARLLLITHSDGSRLIHDHAGFTEAQCCLPGHPRYLGLMCQLGEQLAAHLGISSGGNKPTDAVWDVLAQLPLKYNAYYKTRSTDSSHLDLYIAGHDHQKHDSVRQYALHLAWLAVRDESDGEDGGSGEGGGGGGGGDARCKCKVCAEERGEKKKKTNVVSVAEQAQRKSLWVEYCGPLMQGVPDWRGPAGVPDWRGPARPGGGGAVLGFY